MSLINKMLQDLDARGSQAGDFIDMDVKSVVVAEPRVSTPMLAGMLLGVMALAVAGIFGWRYFKQTESVPAPAAVIVAKPAAPAPLPVAIPVAVPLAAPAPVVAPVATVATPPVKPAVDTSRQVEAKRVVRAPASERARIRVVQAAVPAPAPAVQGRQPGAPRSAQTVYANALARLQEGRIEEAIVGLEQAVQIDPRHEAARQTLVGLLIEDNRPEQAMTQLQAGLAVDARQPSLAMLLARMQIERGASGVDTLQRSLPAAGNNADYHALLAGALQREQRHVEAVELYLAALRTAPQNGVWLMGLGISLQEGKRDADAVAAFQRARDSGTLSPQLLAFVERRLQQLAK